MQVMCSNREERAEMLEDTIIRDKAALPAPVFQQVTQIVCKVCQQINERRRTNKSSHIILQFKFYYILFVTY
jgi:hypothetical protein